MIKLLRKLFMKKEQLKLTSKGEYFAKMFSTYPDLSFDEVEELYCKTFGIEYEPIKMKREQEKIQELEYNKKKLEEWLYQNPNAKIVKVKIIECKGEYSWLKNKIGKVFEIYNVPCIDSGWDEHYYHLTTPEAWGLVIGESHIEFLDE